MKRVHLPLAIVIAIGVFVLVSLVVAVAWAGRVSEGARALADADAALGRGDAIDAILAARTAATARCPGCTAAARGYAKLAHIAEDAEARGDDPTAFAAWRSYRAALLSTSFTTRSEERTHVELELARLAHRLDATAVAAGAPPTAAAAEDKLRTQLAEDAVPSGASLGLVGFGALLFFVMAARFAFARRSGSETRYVELALAALGMAVASLGALAF